MQNLTTPRLRAEAEVSLGLRIQAGNQATIALNDTDLEAAERQQYERLVADGKDAQETLIIHNLRLVRSRALRYAGVGRDLDDMEADGREALVIVSSRFDPALGTKFSTFAVPHIDGAIQHGLDWSPIIREPREKAQKRRRVNRAQACLMASTASQPTTDELAEATNLTTAYIEDLACFDPRVATLDGALDVACPDSSTPASIEAQAEAARCLGLMTAREAQIVRMFWGLDERGTKKSQNEIAAILGINQSTVSRVYNRGLRRALESHESVAA